MGAAVAGTGDHIHVCQVNVGRMRGPLDSPTMAGFVARLGEINALADRSPGFVWRLSTPEGDATYVRPYDDDRILVNLSVWRTLEDLRRFVYESAHIELLRRRSEWFVTFDGPSQAVWWAEAGRLPSVEEAKQRLAHLAAHGPTTFAFTLRTWFAPHETA